MLHAWCCSYVMRMAAHMKFFTDSLLKINNTICETLQAYTLYIIQHKRNTVGLL
jgi:hypothetical protein